MTYELNVDRFYAQLGVFFYLRYFTWYRDEIWIKLNLMTQDFHVDRFYAQLGAFFCFRYFIWYRDKTWIKLELMTYEFNVDRFDAQLGAFSFFVISYDRGIKLGSNWNSWHMNLMLTDFTPNWALFLFSLFHILERWNLDQIESHDPGFSCWQILRPIGRFFYFRYFIW